MVIKATNGTESDYAYARETYVICHPTSKYPKIYSKSGAKSKFAYEFRFGFEQRMRERPNLFLAQPRVYKSIDGRWKCIFNPDSPAGHAFLDSKITLDELKKCIDW